MHEQLLQQLPADVRFLADLGATGVARRRCTTTTEHVLLSHYVGDHEDAIARCEAALDETLRTTTPTITVDDDTVTVEVTDFYGTHAIIGRDGNDVSAHGSYLHVPTDTECHYDGLAMHDDLVDAVRSEPADAAAREAYRRTRL